MDTQQPRQSMTERDPGDAVPPEDEIRTADEAAQFARYAADPVAFARQVLGQTPWSRQAEIMRAVATESQTTVRSSHGVGKTWVAAALALWWVYTRRPSLVLTTAPTARQVEGLLWAEVNRLWRKAGQAQGQPLPGRCLQTRLDGCPAQQAVGLTTNEPERFAGWHSEHLLVIVDEASGVSDRLFEVVQGTLTSADCRLLLIGNPTRTEGLFFRSHRSDGWTKLRISAYDTPNFGFQILDFGLPAASKAPDSDALVGPIQNPKSKIQNPPPFPYLVTPAWVEQRRREWGEDSDAFRVRVLGEFPRASADSLIALEWVEQAEGRCSGIQVFRCSGEAVPTPEHLN